MQQYQINENRFLAATWILISIAVVYLAVLILLQTDSTPLSSRILGALSCLSLSAILFVTGQQRLKKYQREPEILNKLLGVFFLPFFVGAVVVVLMGVDSYF